jgi:CDP-4-dehydro-6-deoxyglucose reductase
VLSARLYEQSRELADFRLHLERYHAIVVEAIEKLKALPSRPEIDDLAKWLDHALEEALVTASPDQLDALEGYLRLVSAHVTLRPSGHEYFSEGKDTLLEAALRAGHALNYGCSSGNCGLCKARVVSGQTKKVRHHDYVFSEAEKNMGYILTCSHAAVTDVVIEALEANCPEDIPAQEIETKVRAVENQGSTVRLMLQTPRTSRLRFLAGQSVSIGGRDYPIASCPCDDRNLEFHIPQDDALAGVARGQSLMLRGPFGNFVLREDTGRQPCFIVSGTGFAPVKSLIEHAMALDVFAALALYRIGEDRYLANLCRAWEHALDNFSYVESQDLACDPDLSERDVYVSGPADFLDNARTLLLEKGVPESRIFIPSDA